MGDVLRSIPLSVPLLEVDDAEIALVGLDLCESETIVHLEVTVGDRREDADRAADQARAEGLSADVGRPLVGDSWAVTISGEPESVLAFGDRLRGRPGD